MIKFWNFVGGMYVFFNKQKWILRFVFALIIVVQFIVIVVVLLAIKGYNRDLITYQNLSSQRINQIYSQVYILNSNVNQFLEKQK